MKRKLINWLGLTGIIAFISYTAAVVISPSAYPGYNWLAQAVSDLSAESAPSRMLWNRIAAPYDICSIVCAVCVSVFVQDNKISTGLFRTGIHLFTAMNWVSGVGYAMFPLSDGGKKISSFGEVMHMIVTALVVLLSVASLVILIAAGFRDEKVKKIGIWAGAALLMMTAGSVGTGLVPPQYFGIAERFSVFAAVGMGAVLGWHLFSAVGVRDEGTDA